MGGVSRLIICTRAGATSSTGIPSWSRAEALAPRPPQNLSASQMASREPALIAPFSRS
jgi:hypothetical protein